MINNKYKKIYDKFIEHYKNVHVNPWHEINEKQLNNIYESLVYKMDINDEYTFKYFIDHIIKRLSGKTDAHTLYDSISPIPMNFRMFNNEILINFPKNLKGSKTISINGICIDKIIEELENVITYGTIGKRIYEIEKCMFNKYVLFGLPSLRNSKTLSFEIETLDNKIITREFKKNEKYSNKEMFNYDEYKYGNNAIYKFIDNCLIYNHSSVQNKFKKQIEESIDFLKKEDLSKIDKIIIDIRGNLGGNSSLNKPLINFLNEHKDKKIICLTDYRIFSGGRYALNDLINLGAITIGEEISTPMNCYGNSNWINIDEHYFSVSECYFHPILGISVSSKEEYKKIITSDIKKEYIYKPSIYIKQQKEDFIKNKDIILEYAIEYKK